MASVSAESIKDFFLLFLSPVKSMEYSTHSGWMTLFSLSVFLFASELGTPVWIVAKSRFFPSLPFSGKYWHCNLSQGTTIFITIYPAHESNTNGAIRIETLTMTVIYSKLEFRRGRSYDGMTNYSVDNQERTTTWIKD
mgnify:CR=1 FL=1